MGRGGCRAKPLDTEYPFGTLWGMRDCEFCGAGFDLYPSNVEWQDFCSEYCADRWHKENRK